MVEYRWHPLFGRKVVIHGEVRKLGLLYARCRVDGDAKRAVIEIPRWMLDRVRCLAMRLENAPQVSWQALAEVRAILGATEGPCVVNGRCDLSETKGDADAHPTPPGLVGTTAAVRTGTSPPAMGEPSRPAAPGSRSVDGEDAERVPGKRRRKRTQEGGER